MLSQQGLESSVYFSADFWKQQGPRFALLLDWVTQNNLPRLHVRTVYEQKLHPLPSQHPRELPALLIAQRVV